jgi:hypothetical protein
MASDEQTDGCRGEVEGGRLARSGGVVANLTARARRLAADRFHEHVLPGDVFAWRRPRGFPSKNTGHVGFVVAPPLPVPEIPGAWAVRIADSTSSYHQNDARALDHDGGFGIGTVVFLTDAKGRVTSYGWSGTASEWYIVTPVVFGRVHRCGARYHGQPLSVSFARSSTSTAVSARS